MLLGFKRDQAGEYGEKRRFYRDSLIFTHINKNKLIDCFSISRACFRLGLLGGRAH